ncbi:MAG: chitobiase/beta-hexosaminidase C-terminal domain-containing protein, partial [Geobacteraceae bacterium]|nr:chitobiase/beta-hexosaminidase C-terminal domain-containing protein [Geobacteraceae bacterium]
YFYRLTTVDNLGNEGEPGNVASGVPRDLITMQPIIVKPTSSGSPFVAYQNQVTVMGLAEPGALVNIMRNNELLGTGTASSQILQTDVASNLDSSYVSLSPDGSTLAYLNSSSFEMRDLANATVKSVSVPLIYLVDIPKWSPSGRYIVILGYDDSWSARLAIYDRTVDTIQVIPTGDSIYNADVSWSPKEDLFVFTGYNSNWQGNLWLANPADVTAVKVAGVASGYSPQLSPDSSKIAYADNQSLMIYNRQDGSVKLVDDNTDGANFAWSPDGTKLAFISYRDGEGDVYSYDLADGVITRRSFSQKNGGSLAWSPDGAQLGYMTYVDPNTLFIVVDRSGAEKPVFATEYGIYGEPEWRSNGELIFIDPVGIHTVYTEGVFSVQLNNLVPGENRLVAIATDPSGNLSIPSEAISVILDIGTLPDLSISDNDIVFFPPYPKPGQDVIATARVHNFTNIPVDNVEVAFYLWDGSSDVKLLSSDMIQHIDANGEASASTRFKAGTVAGVATVIAVVDPGNLVAEVQETNNNASRDLVVTDQEKVMLSSSLNAALYSANQDLYATVTVRNSGLPKSGMLYVALEDITGNLVKLLTNRMTDLPYGADTAQTFVWNSSSTFNGSYRLHAMLQDGATVLAESVSPFTIIPDLSVTGSVVTNKQQYGAGQDVGLTVSLRNSGVNYIIPQLVARVRVLDSMKMVLFTSEQSVANLMPGAPVVLSFSWNSGMATAGAYSVELEILAGSTLVASSSAGFDIVSSISIGGSLKADPAVAVLGSSFAANFELVNNGNEGISGTAVVSLIDPDTMTVIATSEQAVNIPMGGIVSGSASFTTEALRLKNYLIKLSVNTQGKNIPIATAPLGVADTTPPLLIVSTLADGSHTNNSVLNITGTVTDNVGVKQLLINSVSIPFDSGGRYSHALLLKPGENRIEVQATDIAGNSVSDNRTIILDQKAPVLVVTSPADNSKTNKQQLPVIGYVDETCTFETRVNGALQPVIMDGNNFSAMLTLLPGAVANTILVTATNQSGLSSSIKRSVYYDDHVPALAITEPGQDLRTNQAKMVIRGTASDPYGFGVDVSIDMNGQKFTPPLIDGRFEQSVSFVNEETYHIVATATNEMGTIATVPRNIIYDITPPNLTIDPVVTPTNRYPSFLSGTMEEGAMVTIASSTATTGPVEYPTATAWRTPVSTLSGNLNTFTVSAVDVAGNRTVAIAGIDYDIIPPSGTIFINGGAAYSASTQVTLALSADDRIGVSSMRFSSDGAIWTVPETYAVSRIWDLAVGDGSKRVYVQYLDNAGNWSDAVSSAITLDTTAPSISVDPFGGTYGTSQNVKLTTSEPATIYYTLDGSTPTMHSARYSTQLTIMTDTTLKSLAIDLAGNRSDIRADEFIIDTLPPSLYVSTLSDHSFTNNPVLNIAGTVTDNVGVKELRVSNTAVPINPDGSFSYPIVLSDGDNLLVVSASDLAGHTVSDSRTITLDRRAPQLVITNPADNSKTGAQLVTVTGYVDEQSTVTVKLGSGSQIAAMNGQNFSADLILMPGTNTIEVTATDLAGNNNTQKRTVLYDDQIPSVAITSPDKDIRVNQASVLVQGTATDPYTTVAVSLTLDGQSFTPVVTNGQFEQLISFTTEKTYTVSVTAANEVGRTATVLRNIIYDTTAPVLTINPVSTPTAQTAQIVTGIRESDLPVLVTCPTATVGTISYPTATTWSVALTGLQMGDNSITATSTDAAGNVATATTKITIAQASEPIFSHAVFGNKWVKFTGGSFTDSYVGMPASYVTAQHKHGDVGTNSVQLCSINLTGGTQVYGVADVGMGGNAATGVCLTPGTAVSGGKTALSAIKNMAPKFDLGGGASSGAINLNGVAVKNLTTGNYRFSSIKLNGSGKLVISGQVVLHIDGDITLNGAGIIQITAGSSLVIYANGAKIDIGGGAIANASQNPNNLVIYGSASLTTVNLSGGTTLHGYLYAPAADIKISGGQQTFGAIIGNTVDLSGGTSVHYPEGANISGLK